MDSGEIFSYAMILIMITSLLGWLWLLFGRRLTYKLWYRHVYLRSPHWLNFRKIALAAAGWKCEAEGCKNRRILDVHHLSYEHLGNEQLSDVTVLCRWHHNQIHKKGTLPLKKIYQ